VLATLWACLFSYRLRNADFWHTLGSLQYSVGGCAGVFHLSYVNRKTCNFL